jgi:hypothetical protein
MTLEFAGAALPLGPDDVAEIAGELQCDAAAVHALIEVEAAGSGFLPDKRPKILYEAHVFGRLTDHQWDKRFPNLSASNWDRSLYGAGGAHQYDRLGKAIALDRDAALRAASWGLPQILGTNFRAAGFAGVEGLVAAMQQGERSQLEILAAFLKSSRLERFLKAHRWFDFARGYNGPGQVNHYSLALQGAYAKWQAYPKPIPAVVSRATHPATWHGEDKLDERMTLQRGMTGPLIMELQRRLAELGYPVAQDGVFGKQTAGSIGAFQTANGLPRDRTAGPPTLKALNAA